MIFSNKKLQFKEVQYIQFFHGVCNLCYNADHKTALCPFSTVLYHATSKTRLQSILNNGLHHHNGRLGKAIYCSDQPQMCIKFVNNNRNKFDKPIILEIKAMITDIRKIESNSVLTRQDKKRSKKENQVIVCPYFEYIDRTMHEWALFDCDYSVVGYSYIEDMQDWFSMDEGVRYSQIQKVKAYNRVNRRLGEKQQGKEDIIYKNLMQQLKGQGHEMIKQEDGKQLEGELQPKGMDGEMLQMKLMKPVQEQQLFGQMQQQKQKQKQKQKQNSRQKQNLILGENGKLDSSKEKFLKKCNSLQQKLEYQKQKHKRKLKQTHKQKLKQKQTHKQKLKQKQTHKQKLKQKQKLKLKQKHKCKTIYKRKPIHPKPPKQAKQL